MKVDGTREEDVTFTGYGSVLDTILRALCPFLFHLNLTRIPGGK
jgi:hypothetical protein